MVTFTIIEELRSRAKPYKIGAYEDNSLWLADDATIIASSEENILKALNILEETGKKNDLVLSEEKTKIMRVRGPGKAEK